MKQLILLAFVSITCAFNMQAQEYSSFSNSNYAGINAADLNPSFIAYSRYKTDINILQVRGSMFNNNFYLTPQFIPGLPFRSSPNGYLNNAQHASYEKKSSTLLLEENIKSDPTNLFLNATVKGPGIMVSDGFKAFAIQTHFKTIADLNGLNASLSKMLFEQTGYQPLMGRMLSLEKGAGFSAMNYGEVSFTYARMLTNRRNRIINIGVTGKVLIGFNAIYVKSQGSTLSFPTQNNLRSNDVNLDFGYAMPDASTGTSAMFPHGTGLAADVGFSYIRKKDSRLFKISCPSFIRKVCFMPNYKWKFGASLLDIGGINYSSQANTYQYRGASLNWDKVGQTNINTVQQLDQLLQQKTAGTGTMSKDYSFFMALPGALSLQFDYNLNDAFFVSSTLVQRVTWSDGPQVRRLNALVVAPRFETDQIEIAMPLSVYEYQYPSVGMMVRYRGFFMGSDQLGSTLGMARINGADLYMGLKISLGNDRSHVVSASNKRRNAVNLSR